MRKLTGLISPRFLKYLVSGVTAVALDTLTLLLFTDVLHFNPILVGIISTANLVATAVGVIVSYTMNRIWVFEAKQSSVASQGTRYLVVFLFSYTMNNLLFGLFTIYLFVPNVWAKLVVTAMQMIWNFALYKYYVFKS